MYTIEHEYMTIVTRDVTIQSEKIILFVLIFCIQHITVFQTYNSVSSNI